ncbi:MAG: hypothetical protein WD512_07255, partial [Candidatus Paceibacterota bacterium]
ISSQYPHNNILKDNDIYMKKLNTHHYDGQLHTLYREIEGMVKDPPSLETTYQEISELINSLLADDKKARKDTHNILNILRTSTGTSANYDGSNNINVDKLLPLVWACVKEYDNSAKIIFLEQIQEMRNGLCPQGRTTRLIQLVEIPTKSPSEPSTKLSPEVEKI